MVTRKTTKKANTAIAKHTHTPRNNKGKNNIYNTHTHIYKYIYINIYTLYIFITPLYGITKIKESFSLL